jgi:hypothetical protein
MILLLIILIAIQGILDAFKDTLAVPVKYQASFMASWPERWQTFAGPGSWRNKYKNRDPNQGPAFPGATTWLVWLTDAWHLVKFLMIATNVLSLAILIAARFNYLAISPWLFVAIVLFSGILIRGMSFEIFYLLIIPNQMKSFLKNIFSNNWRRGLAFVLLPLAGIFMADNLGATPVIVGLTVAMTCVLLFLLFQWLDRPAKKS